jgi:hypothetical protein
VLLRLGERGRQEPRFLAGELQARSADRAQRQDQELGRWTLLGLAEGWQRYQMAADGAYGEEINLPAPLNFSLTTAGWPRWK